MSREAADVAREAARIVELRGLCKGRFDNPNGEVCLWGALKEASGVDKHTNALTLPHFRELAAGIVRHHPADGRLPGVTFNDAADTTVVDVAKLLLLVGDELEVA